MALTICRSALAALRAAAASAAPNEACGLLLGQAERIDIAQPAANIAADPLIRFEIDPIALIAAHRAARAGGPVLVGYYHSHPAGNPRPSATDCAHASGDGRVWAIVAAETATAWGVTLWRDTAQGFAALSYEAVDG